MPKFLIVCGGSGVGLLGQSKITGVDGELQLDVTDEISYESKDSFVTLDNSAKTGFVLFNKMHKRWGNDPNISDANRNHIDFLYKNYKSGTSTKEGLRQSPAIGGGIIRLKQNEDRLLAKITDLFAGAKMDGDEEVNEFWIISSTAGGTGEGIHRYVGEVIMKFCRENKATNSCVLNFIRIGPGTYASIDVQRVPLNTLLGLAADAAYEDIMLEKSREVDGFPLTINWYYTDLPDVGPGEETKPLRAEIVGIACKTFMSEEIQEILPTIRNNTDHHVIRTGFWGCDFDQKEKLYASLLGLKSKLNELIKPDYESLTKKTIEPYYNESENLKNLSRQKFRQNLIMQKLENKEWEFPKLTGDWEKLDDVNAYVSNLWDKLDGLLGTLWFDRLEPKPNYSIQLPKKDNSSTTSVPFRISPVLNPNNPITEEIRFAHLIKAWTDKLLGRCVQKQYIEGLVEDLRKSADECSKAQHSGFIFRNSSVKAKDLSDLLPGFLDKLVKVKLLLDEFNHASTLLDTALYKVVSLRDNAESIENLYIPQSDHLRSQDPSIIPAELDQPVPGSGNKTWIEMLFSAAEAYGLQNPEEFREAIISGATKLSDSGLRRILGLPGDVSAQRVQEELVKKFGAIKTEEGKTQEGRWWGGHRPNKDDKRLNFRILPELETRLGDSYDNVSFSYSEMGAIGLNVLALESCDFQRMGSAVSLFDYLMRNYVQTLKTVLDDWTFKPGYGGGKYVVALAGNFFEPLYKPVLKNLGFEDAELEKLGEFYDFYEPK